MSNNLPTWDQLNDPTSSPFSPQPLCLWDRDGDDSMMTLLTATLLRLQGHRTTLTCPNTTSRDAALDWARGNDASLVCLQTN